MMQAADRGRLMRIHSCVKSGRMAVYNVEIRPVILGEAGPVIVGGGKTRIFQKLQANIEEVTLMSRTLRLVHREPRLL